MPSRFDAYSLASAGIRGLSPYDPGLPIEELGRRFGIRDAVKLASNENPLGAPERAKRLIRKHRSELHRYPDGSGHELRKAIADRHDVDMNQICLGNGSNDVLDMLARVFVRPGQKGVISKHAFIVYYLSLVYVHAEIVSVEAAGFGHDLTAMADAVDEKTKILYVANPNNPTGTWSTATQLKNLLNRVPRSCIVVVDEAYAEYVRRPEYPNCTQWLGDHPNLVVTRTFSKIFGLAGLRVGYALSSPEIADLLNRVRQPFNCNSIGLAAAAAALQDEAHCKMSRNMNDEQMSLLCQGFKALGLSTIESIGNFVCVDLGTSAAPIYETLLRRGMICRPVGGYGMPDHLRISVGLESENRRLLTEFQRLKEEGALGRCLD